MATSQLSEVIQHLGRAALVRDGAGPTDGQLLADYVSRRDETALAAVVGRHGRMVWGVCRRVLRDHHDAEDAFQATFMVFVRRAASIAKREAVANWLYRVAYWTAIKAKATAAKRRGRERQVPAMPEPAVAPHYAYLGLPVASRSGENGIAVADRKPPAKLVANQKRDGAACEGTAQPAVRRTD